MLTYNASQITNLVGCDEVQLPKLGLLFPQMTRFTPNSDIPLNPCSLSLYQSQVSLWISAWESERVLGQTLSFHAQIMYISGECSLGALSETVRRLGSCHIATIPCRTELGKRSSTAG